MGFHDTGEMEIPTATPDLSSAWKKALRHFHRPYLELCWPDAAADIDWNKPVCLQEDPTPAPGSHTHDRMFEISLVSWHQMHRGPHEQLILHTVVQTKPRRHFSLMMFDRYLDLFLGNMKTPTEVSSMAILADNDPDWKPNEYRSGSGTCSISFTYNILKLLELPEQELELSQNPFGLVLLAYQLGQKWRKHPDKLQAGRLRLQHRIGKRDDTQENREILREITTTFLETTRCGDENESGSGSSN